VTITIVESPPPDNDNASTAQSLASAFASLVRRLPGARRVDSWVNVLTGLGHGLVDKTRQTVPMPFRGGLPDPVLADLFHTDAIARKIVCKLPADALRLGFTVNVPKEAGGHEVASAIQDEADDLDLVSELKTACYWERLFGGAVLYMAIDDGQYSVDSQALPVRRDAITQVLWVKALDRTRIRPSYAPADLDPDPNSATFGEPQIWLMDVRMTGAQIRVHRSRLIIFPGATTTDYERRARGGWGISVLDFVYDALQRNAVAWSSAASAVANCQYVIYKLKGMSSMFSMQGGEDKAKQRASAMEMAKSMINAVLIDAEDDYIRENPNFGNLPLMLDQFMLDVCAAADMQSTVLWGRSPAGMNATGESDIELWNNTCDAFRRHHLRSRLHEVLEVLMLSKEGPTQGALPDGWSVVFPALRQLSDVEKATVRLQTSQADASDITAGILLPQEVAVSRFKPEGYSLETQIDIDTRERLLKIEMDQREVELKAGRGPGQTPEEPAPLPPGAKPPAKKAAA
jgi:phage-related protein (TIGR01555 family)